MPTLINATYLVTTPMFCGGADPANAELRLPSFKGALRFWWRALAWPRLGGDLKAIQREEDALFGSTAKGQSRVVMRLTGYKKRPSEAGHLLGLGLGAKYLGYGVMERGSRARNCLKAPFDFTVRMRGRDLNATQRSSLRNALIALGVFGGMGAKSRKGYGSLTLRSLLVDRQEQWQKPRSMEELGRTIQGTVESLPIQNGSEDILYTAISKRSRWLLLESDNQPSRGHRQSSRDAMTLLDRIGVELKDAVDDVPNRDRIAFGLPRASRGASIPGVKRRASPLFIHIHECEGAPVVVLSFLPARFLPEGRLSVPVERKVRQYKPIRAFLDSMTSLGDDIRVVEVRP